MYKILIADDEPLSREGVKSMLDRVNLDVEVIGMARNGRQAMEIIEKQMPDIVITDIKMPVKDGLTLQRECNEKFAFPPAFIILTSYDEFEFVRAALKERAADYLIKPEIDEKTLTEAILSALEHLRRDRRTERNMAAYGDFFVKLFNNQFESEEAFISMKRSTAIPEAPFYLVVDCVPIPTDISADVFARAVKITRDLLSRGVDVYVVSPETLHFSVVVWLETAENYKTVVARAFGGVLVELKNSLNLSLSVSAGSLASELRNLGASYSLSRSGHGETGEIVFYNSPQMGKPHKERIVRDIKRYIRENFRRKLSLDEVAEKFSYNASYISRLFSECAGESIVDYLMAQRVEEARKLLSEGTLNIAEIAESVGFENRFYFSRVFKRVTGISPSKYERYD